jgi:hypothetical protein
MKNLCGICTSPGNRLHTLNNKGVALCKLLQHYCKLHEKTGKNSAIKNEAKNAYHQAWLKSEGIVRPVTAPPRQRGTVLGQIQNKENNTKRNQMETERGICVTPGNRCTTKQKANAFARYIRLFNALHTKTPATQQAKKALENQFRRPNSAAPPRRPNSAAPAGRPKSAAPARRPQSAPAGRPQSVRNYLMQQCDGRKRPLRSAHARQGSTRLHSPLRPAHHQNYHRFPENTELRTDINNLLRRIETNIKQNATKTPNQRNKGIQKAVETIKACENAIKLSPNNAINLLLQLKDALFMQLKGKATNTDLCVSRQINKKDSTKTPAPPTGRPSSAARRPQSAPARRPQSAPARRPQSARARRRQPVSVRKLFQAVVGLLPIMGGPHLDTPRAYTNRSLSEITEVNDPMAGYPTAMAGTSILPPPP